VGIPNKLEAKEQSISGTLLAADLTGSLIHVWTYPLRFTKL